ncbi:GPP34 family phosphoprotein [Frankia nepalensis]|nr:GPP34 family phosphoprotein [Frankia nepalensis]
MYRVPGFGRTLRAAALTQLLHDGLVTDTRGLVVPVESTAATERPMDWLSSLVLRQAWAGPPRTWARWISHDQRRAVRIVRAELAKAGWVDLGPRPDGLPRRGRTTVSVSPPDRQTVRVLNRAVGRALRGEIATPDVSRELAALVALGAAGDVITLVSARQRSTWPERIAELATLAGPPALALAARD